MSWWLSNLNQKLSQGDVVSGILLGSAAQPIKYLDKQAIEKAGKKSWLEASKLQPLKSTGKGFYISSGLLTHAIIISHSCELDKGSSNQVLIAPIAPLARIKDPGARERVQSQQRRALLPLPDITGLGDYYTDLRALSYVEKKNISDENRIASMSEDGLHRLHAQLVAFFTRTDLDTLESKIKEVNNVGG